MDTTSNNRKTTRIRSFKSGRIIYNDRVKTLDCIVKNMSEEGAKLVLSVPESLPDAFSVRFIDGRERTCAVRWRVMNEIGVQYC